MMFLQILNFIFFISWIPVSSFTFSTFTSIHTSTLKRLSIQRIKQQQQKHHQYYYSYGESLRTPAKQASSLTSTSLHSQVQDSDTDVNGFSLNQDKNDDDNDDKNNDNNDDDKVITMNREVDKDKETVIDNTSQKEEEETKATEILSSPSQNINNIVNKTNEYNENDDSSNLKESNDQNTKNEKSAKEQIAATTKTQSSPSSWADWSAPSSLGTFLLKQKKLEEEEMKKTEGQIESKNGDDNKDINVNEDANQEMKKIATGGEEKLVSFIDLTKIARKKDNIVSELDVNDDDDDDITKGLDEDLVREVDDSVTILSAPWKTMMRDIAVLPITTQPKSVEPLDDTNNISSKKLPLSGPAHTERIEKDMRHLAVSIASTIEDAEQYKTFCEDGGGLLPLLECIRDSADEIVRGQNVSLMNEKEGIEAGAMMVGLVEKREEAFAAACTACKTLRDLCAISKPFAAIVTDSILRVDETWSTSVEQVDGQTKLEGGLISNLGTLLQFSQQADNLYTPRSRRERLRMLRNRGVQRFGNRKQKRDARQRCGLYVTQLLLEMTFTSDKAVYVLRATKGLTETVLACSSYAQAERLRRRWIRYPIEAVKRYLPSKVKKFEESPFLAAAAMDSGLSGQIKGSANQLLASIGHNVWYPKTPGQRGLRILCLDGGGTRGITAISSMRSIVDALGGVEVCDAFDMIAGTSTGAIIAFLVGLRRESSEQARKRYDALIKKIFVKSALSTPMLLFTTATYDETPFNTVVGEILRDNSMLSSRADPRVPLVFAISSKMSSTPTQICLFRNYNYGGGEMPDAFVLDPIDAKKELGLELEDDIYKLSGMLSLEEGKKCIPQESGGSRHPGSFRVLQRAALRATTAAPTVFKPVLMGGELYCDGGIVASNPAAVAIHEARTIYPNIPIELVVSCGTGAFVEEKSAPRIGWDGIIGQIVNSACDGEQIHHILEDILGGQGGTAKLGGSVSKTKYYRFNPVVGTSDAFPIDGTDPIKLEELSQLTSKYMNEPEQRQKLDEIVTILKGSKTGLRKRLLSKIGIAL